MFDGWAAGSVTGSVLGNACCREKLPPALPHGLFIWKTAGRGRPCTRGRATARFPGEGRVEKSSSASTRSPAFLRWRGAPCSGTNSAPPEGWTKRTSRTLSLSPSTSPRGSG
ncbi:hypothetical protein HMPREF0262_00626 [Clostridium sp. ATCC 29733]|nr:hypothetical protein HMPREF0262_00626 [Clostridium sp. ATCC 29733]